MWRKNHKYNAKKTEVMGIKFDSKKEANRYLELKMLARAGKIRDLKLQPKFLLLDKFKYGNKTQRAIHYVADFEYIDEKGVRVVEDVKGYKTEVYNIKKKLFLSKYSDVEFREI
jgi:hypothetical protein